MNGYFRRQTEIVEQVRTTVRDKSESRWTQEEVYSALNEALMQWSGRVEVPMIYPLPNGFTGDTDTYSLPAYIRGTVQPQMRRVLVGEPSGTTASWVNLRTFHTEPDADGGSVFRVKAPTGEHDLSTDGRILWYAPNSRVPLTPPTSTSVAPTDTTITIMKTDASRRSDIDEVGYITSQGQWEICQYAGVSDEDDRYILQNVRRGLFATPSTPEGTATWEWMVYAPSMALFALLGDMVKVHLHQMFPPNASPQTGDHHERLLLYYERRVQEGWRRFSPARKPRMIQPYTA